MAYKVGLIFVLSVILISVDDLVWDIYYYINKALGKFKKRTIYYKDIEETVPKMLAVLVAAYNEENVLKKVIENMVKSNQYPDSMYQIFLGVYPNDPGTLKIADELVEEFKNVHKVVHVLDGPSSKADNLNNVIKNIYIYEEENNVEFAAIIIHDSEDLVHPYELMLDNYLLDYYPAIQIPVFPLQKESSFKNLIANTISGTYLDEFAENHYRQLVARTQTGAFVPSAGTGFVIRRDVLESFPDNNIFPVGSLTEDYKLSLQMKQKGFGVYYVLDDIIKLMPDGRTARKFIATRSMFPSNYRAAVKQKTRWIYGITMQSFNLKEVLKSNKLNFQSKYSLYKDWKAKFGNLLLGPGYLIFIYFILSRFFNLPTLYPKHTISWYLMVFLSIMMIERQILRFTAIKKVYGYKSAIISTLLPPILPFRMLVGNLINFHATVKAWLTRFSSNKKKKPKKVKWSKTDHDFLEEEVLKTFRLSLGDVLLNKNFITREQLNKIMNNRVVTNEELAKILLSEKLVSEPSIVKALCEIEKKEYVSLKPGRYLSELEDKYGRKLLSEIEAIPLMIIDKKLAVITTLNADMDRIREVFKGYKLFLRYTSSSELEDALFGQYIDEDFEDKILKIESYIRKKYIDVSQGIIAVNFTRPGEDIDETLGKMGLLKINNL